MRFTGAVALSIWGTILCAVTLLGVLVFGLDALPASLLGGAGVGAIATGLIWGRSPVAHERRHQDAAAESVGIAAIALGITLAGAGLVAAGGVVLAAGLVVTGIGTAMLIWELAEAGRRR